MKERFANFLSDIRGREVILWGMGALLDAVVQTLDEMNVKISGFTSTTATKNDGYHNGLPILDHQALSPSHHYVIITTKYYAEITPSLNKLCFRECIDYYPWFSRTIHQDFLYDGVPIGRDTYGFQTYRNFIGRHSAHNAIESIGRFTSISSTAKIHGDHSKNMICQGYLGFLDPKQLKNYTKKYSHLLASTNRVVIGHDVWIGANSFINYSKVKHVGSGSVIAAGAVVVKDVPEYSIVAGVPAKVIKYRFSKQEIAILLKTEWWSWSDEQLRENGELLISPDLFCQIWKGRSWMSISCRCFAEVILFR